MHRRRAGCSSRKRGLNQPLQNKMELKKILAVRDDRMGDFILTLPSITALQEAYPKARLTVAVSPALFPLAARILPGKNVFSHYGSFVKFYSFLKSEKFDLVVFFRPRLGTALAGFLGLFWLYRALVQFLLYSRIWPAGGLGRLSHHGLCALFTFQSAVYLMAAAAGFLGRAR